MALTELFYDTFTDTAGTLLTAHTPDTGLGWTPLAGNIATNAQIGSDGTAVQPFHSGTGDNYYTANTSQTETLHQSVEAVHGTALTRICLRLTNGSTAADGVRVDFNTALNKVFVYTITNAVETQLASSYSVISIPAGAVCVATITAANILTVTVNGTLVDWAVGVTELTVNGYDAGKFGWMGRKSYTTGGITSYKGFYDVGGGAASNITISETLPALSSSMSMTFTSAAGTSNVSISDTLPALDSSLSMTFTAAGVGTITIPDWANNTGTALPSITDITVNVRSLVDGSTVYRTTTASTDVNADCVVSDAAIVSGTQYEVTALKFNGVDYDIGIAIITAT